MRHHSVSLEPAACEPLIRLLRSHLLPLGEGLLAPPRLHAMTHLGYIIAAYLATAIVLLGMVLWAVLDLRAAKRKLARLEEEGLRRRSEVAR